MLNKKNHNRDRELLTHLGGFSKKVIDHHHLENLSEFIVHDLCFQAFAIPKAAYLVNNPDFKCLKGIAGYHHIESYAHDNWNKQKDFSSHMKNAEFNNRVRKVDRDAIIIEPKNLEDVIMYLDMHDPQMHTWNLKHDNQGIFLFEESEKGFDKQDLSHFLQILSFCPIF